MTWGQLASVVAAARPSSTGPAAASARTAQAKALAALLGAAWDEGAGPVSREQALSVPAMHRGANLIAGTIGSMQLRCYRGLDPQDTTPAGQFLSQPEADRPRSHTIGETVTDLVFDGIAAWWITARYADGTPRTARRMAPGEFSVQSDWSVRYAGERIPYRDVIVFYGPDSTTTATGTIAKGLLTTAARTIRTAIRLEEAAARYAWNEIPYGSITQDDGAEELEEAEIEELLSEWETARRRRATAYLPAGLKYNPVTGPNPEQLQLTEARTFIASEIARHLNLPPRYVGASSGDTMTYNSQGADRRDLAELGLRTWFAAIEERLSMDPNRTDPRVATVTPTGLTARFDRLEFEASDPEKRVDSAVKLEQAKIISRDEARAMLRLPPDGGTG